MRLVPVKLLCVLHHFTCLFILGNDPCFYPQKAGSMRKTGGFQGDWPSSWRSWREKRSQMQTSGTPLPLGWEILMVPFPAENFGARNHLYHSLSIKGRWSFQTLGIRSFVNTPLFGWWPWPIKVKELGVNGWYMWWPALDMSLVAAMRAMPQVQLNYDYSAKLHCDKNNLGPSFIIGWGLPRMKGGWKSSPLCFFFLHWPMMNCKDEFVRLMRQDSEYITWGQMRSACDFPRLGPYTGGELFIAEEALLEWEPWLSWFRLYGWEILSSHLLSPLAISSYFFVSFHVM